MASRKHREVRRSDDLLDPATWPKHGETPVTPGWRSVSIGFEGDPVDLGGGLDPWAPAWRSGWRSAGEWIVVAHPQYPDERHRMFVYEIDAPGGPVTFAAGEYSNGVWGFHVPEAADGRGG